METVASAAETEHVANTKIRAALDAIIAVPKDRDPEGRIGVLSLAALMIESLHENSIIGTPSYDAFKAEIITLAEETPNMAEHLDGR